jgi:signal peptidase I
MTARMTPSSDTAGLLWRARRGRVAHLRWTAIASTLATFFLSTPQPAYAGACWCPECLFGTSRGYQIMSSHMKPTLEAGDCVIIQPGKPLARGDLIAFRESPYSDPTMSSVDHLFRLVGLPGDEIVLRRGIVYLNGTALQQVPAEPYRQVNRPEGPKKQRPACFPPIADDATCIIERFTERLPEGVSWQILNLRADGFGDDAGPFIVPSNHVFVLGDNRDNAADSRFSLISGGRGMIPAEKILGPVVRVLSR